MADIPKSEPDDLESWDGDTSWWLEPGPKPATQLSAREQGEKLKAMFGNPKNRLAWKPTPKDE